MSLTIQQIILDAKRLASRLKEHDTAADLLLSQTQSVYKQLDAMKQYQEDVNELNDVARQRPHAALAAGIQQENRHLRRLQLENRELRAALEEHQYALELIMSKYRQQTDALVQQNRLDMTGIGSSGDVEKLREQSNKIAEMAAVMNRVATMDEESSVQDYEYMTQLITENRGLRELLQISHGAFSSLKADAQKEEGEKMTSEITSSVNEQTAEEPDETITTKIEQINHNDVSGIPNKCAESKVWDREY